MRDPTEPVRRYQPFADGTAPDYWPTEFVSADDFDATLADLHAAQDEIDRLKVEIARRSSGS